MTDIRILLAHDPRSFDELLDLFEGYVATIGEPVLKARDLAYGEGEDHRREVVSTLLTTADDADRLAQRLRQIRARRQATGMVELELTPSDARFTDTAARELQEMVGEAAAALHGVHRTITHDPACLADDWQMPAGTLETINLARRVLDDAAERHCAWLRVHAHSLAQAAQRLDEEEIVS